MSEKKIGKDGESLQWDWQKRPLEPAPGAFAAPSNLFFTTLVIDANFSFAGFLEEFLETEGHSILRSSNAEDAIAKTRQFQPDLILLDNDIEGVSGLSLLPALLMEQSSAAVILLAGTPSIAEAVEAIKRGAVDYLERPLDPAKLKAAIDEQRALAVNQRGLGLFGGGEGQTERRQPGHVAKPQDGAMERRKDDDVGGEGG